MRSGLKLGCTMPHAIQVHRFGGPEVLTWDACESAALAPTEVRIRHTAIGLNFVDVYERSGLYQRDLPFVPGHEAAGVIIELGVAVTRFQVGDRVAYASAHIGAYSEQRTIAADRLVKLPSTVEDQHAAALMLKGLTAQALVRRVFPLAPQHVALVHAAAGGVGSILVQWAKYIGASVIAVVGSEAKREIVRARHVDHVWLANEPWAERVREQGGVDVVYDSVGLESFMKSLDCLKRRGMMVTFGNASGPPPAISPLELSKRGSLFLTRPSVFDYITQPEELQSASEELFELTTRSVIGVHIGQKYSLQDASRAHRELESRRTIGSTVLLP
jgi:NADPH:quinone reductase